MKIKHKPATKKNKPKKYTGPGSVMLFYESILPGEFTWLCEEHAGMLKVSKPEARHIKRRIDDMANLLQARTYDIDD